MLSRRRLNICGVEKKLRILVSLWTMIFLDWRLLNVRLFVIDLYQRLRKILSIMQFFFPYCGKFIHHSSDCTVALQRVCRKSLHSNVVHTKVTKAAFELLKARITSALVFLIPKSDHEATCFVVINANKIGIIGLLSLR